MKPHPYNDSNKPHLKWVVRIPAVQWDGSEPQRRFFENEREAVLFSREREAEHKEHGRGALSREDRATWTLARKIAGSSEQILEILRAHAKSKSDLTERVTIPDLVERFKAHQSGRVSLRTMADDRVRLAWLVGQLGDAMVDTLEPSALARMMDAAGQGSNARNRYKVARKLFAYALRRGYCQRDPFLVPGSELRPPRVAYEPPSIVTPSDLKTILGASSGVCRVFLTLKAFLGLRSSELVRAYVGEQVLDWSDFDWSKQIVRIRREVAKKTRRRDNERFINLGPGLEWLEARPLSGPCIPITEANLRIQLRKLPGYSSFGNNALRHSFASHFLAVHPGEVSRLAQILGDSEQVARSHYIRTLPAEQGREWFDLGSAIPVEGSV